jgi:PAS domain S-box-containing protein
MKLSRRFLFFPLLLGIFFYLFYTAYKNVKDKTLKEFNTNQFILANQASRGIESFFIYYQRELNFLSSLKNIIDLNDQGKALLNDFYSNHSDQIEAITIVDDKGILVHTIPYNPSIIGQDISAQEHVKKIINAHEPVISDVFTSVQGYQAIAYHMPIMDGDKYKGSIAILIPLENLGKRYIENIRIGENGYGWMISKDGVILYSPVDGTTGKTYQEALGNFSSIDELFNKTMNETEGTIICYKASSSGSWKNSIKTFASFLRVSLGKTYWTILILTPEKEVIATFKTFRDRLYLLFLLITVVMTIYLFLAFKAGAILKDESRRKALENILRESEKRFRVMFELSPAGIILIDEKGTIIEVNTSFCETLGYSRKELISNNIRLFSSATRGNEIEKNIEVILQGNTLKHEVTNFRKDGTTCEIELYETMILLPDGKPGILSVSNDITEKKRSEEKMLTLSRAMESIGECVSITDLNNKIIYLNNAFCKTYGYSREEIYGHDIGIIRSPKTDEKLGDKILSDTINGGWTGELINVRKDGTEFPVELSASLITDEDGRPVALIGIAVDITERNRVRQELIFSKEKAEESDKLKSTFLTNMSHELRTPLNAIIGFSSFMADTAKDEETVTYSKIIFDSGQHLLKLVEDILDTSMIEIGQLKINYEKVEIVSLLREVKNIITGERLRENKADIDIILRESNNIKEKIIVTDSRKLKQVLLNLLKNALKYTNEGFIEFGFAEVKKAGADYLEFYVKDTGIGIDKKYHEVIFNVFRQIDDTYSRKHGGAGIGLSIVKSIVEMLKGQLFVESEPGKGSRFSFTVPALTELKKTDSSTTDDASSSEKNYDGRTVLIAEDEDSNYEFLRIFLSRMKINVIRAKDGQDAVNQCETNHAIDLVLMDIKLPLLNGFEATRKIKEKHADMPVVAQTAYAMISDKEEAFKAGCDDYLSKPLQIDQLKVLLDKYLL